jgi:integrase
LEARNPPDFRMNELTIVTVAPVPAHLNHLLEAGLGYAHAGVSPNTRRAFEGASRSFSRWCASVGVSVSPADADHVTLYLAARAPKLAASTLALHLSALNWFAKAEGAKPPGDDPRVKAVMAGIRRVHGRPPAKKRGLLGNDLKRVVKRLPASLAGLRDRAILLVGFAAALRRSELAALSIDGLVRAVFVTEGLEIHVGRAKGDQQGRGAVVAVPFGSSACPVGALNAWIGAADIGSGPIFRAIDRHGRLGLRQLSDRSIANIIKAGVGSIGLSPASFSGHSLRRGAITTMHRGGARDSDLQRHARHKRWDTTALYIEEADRFATSAARKSGL